MGIFLTPTATEISNYNNGLCFSMREYNSLSLRPYGLRTSGYSSNQFLEYSDINNAPMVLISGTTYSSTQLVKIKDIYIATYKRIRLIIQNRRSSGELDVDKLYVYASFQNGSAPPVGVRLADSANDTNFSLSNGSTKTFYMNVPINPSAYSGSAMIGINIGTFAAKRKIFFGTNYLSLT
jgi:hypothetical protein